MRTRVRHRKWECERYTLSTAWHAAMEKRAKTRQRSSEMTEKHRTNGVESELDPQAKKGVSLKKEFTLSSGVAIIVGQIIGSGIFITPKSILSHAGSFGVSLIMWFFGALVAMAGGLCYIELGFLVKRGGAELGYLIEAYSFKNRSKWSELLGSLLGFLFVWSNVCILRPASLAIQSLTCAHYLTLPLYGSSDEVPAYLVKAVAIFLLGKLSTLHPDT